MNEIEEWRDIGGYEGSYQVSNFGRVKSLDRVVMGRWGTDRRIKEKVLKEFVSRNGYCIIELCLDGVRKKHLVHRMVAKAFVLGEKDGDQVNHIDEDKTNNNSNNLEWCTPRENVGKYHSTKYYTSKRLNVHWSNLEEIWKVTAYRDSEHRYIGMFYKESDAISASDYLDEFGYEKAIEKYKKRNRK
jgi:hypothetical protein